MSPLALQVQVTQAEDTIKKDVPVVSAACTGDLRNKIVRQCKLTPLIRQTQKRKDLEDFLHALEMHRGQLDIQIDDVVEMMSVLRQLPRHSFLTMAVSAWLYSSVGISTTLEDCYESKSVDSTDTQLVFRVRLDANDASLRARRSPEDIASVFKGLLVAALPEDARRHAQIIVDEIIDNDRKCVRLGVLLDIIALSCLVIVEGAHYLRETGPDARTLSCVSPCGVRKSASLEERVARSRYMLMPPNNVSKEITVRTELLCARITDMLRRRQAQFKNNFDGSALLMVREGSEKWMCPVCTIL